MDLLVQSYSLSLKFDQQFRFDFQCHVNALPFRGMHEFAFEIVQPLDDWPIGLAIQ